MPKTSLFLMFILCSSFISSSHIWVNGDTCESFELSYTLDRIDSAYQISVKVKNPDESSYRYMFYDEKGKHVTKGYEYKSNKVTVNKKGLYHAVVYDSKGCSSKLKIRISE